eukprot:12931794-Prorocentrum_lima.AAC.1
MSRMFWSSACPKWPMHCFRRGDTLSLVWLVHDARFIQQPYITPTPTYPNPRWGKHVSVV